MNVLHLYPNGQVEVGTGKPGYRWTPAYSQANGHSACLTRANWRGMAKRDKVKLVFHKTRDQAIAALTVHQEKMSRSEEIRREKAKANARGHEMGNVVNVSPFPTTDPEGENYSVHSRCRKCRRGMYVHKDGKAVKSWGDALQADC